MATLTVTKLATLTISASATASSTLKATPQGGILEGGNPSHYDPKNPIILFVIQASLVLIFTRLLNYPLSKLRQPQVIAEVITGIILGPSIMGRIPGFTDAIFPTTSMPAFTLAANIGLVLFLFLVGLEVDLRYLVSNWRIALSVGAAGMAIPFGLGWGIAWGLYHEFREPSNLVPISFAVYALFIGVAMAITAFPVLCRILTSLKLLHTPVGVIVLSAGVGNDVVGWILLALCVTLVNSSGGLTALYILLVAVGYILFVVFAVRPIFVKLLHRSGSFQNGPTQSVVALTVLLVLASAFFTGIIGIHPIFGAFIIGLICPHESGFAIKLTEKLEDLVSVLFLPLYFALSGLSTNLGLLDSGITWAYVVGVICVAFFGKVLGGTLASRLNGLVWRESLTIGCLMSCKGLVELIVLNIGLQAKILTTRTFTIFVVMALVTTFATTPLTTYLYPKSYQQKIELWKQGKIDWAGNKIMPDEDPDAGTLTPDRAPGQVARKLLVYLRFDGLPGLFTLVNMLSREGQAEAKPAADVPEGQTEPQSKEGNLATSIRGVHRPVQVHSVRLMELTSRDSSVMKVSELEDYARRDPIIKAFGTFAQSKHLDVSGHVAVVPEHSFSSTLLSRAEDVSADMLLIPWSETGSMSEYPTIYDHQNHEGPLENRPFASMVVEAFRTGATACNIGVLFDKSTLAGEEESAPIMPMLSRTVTNMSMRSAHHVQATFAASSNGMYRIIVPYMGSVDVDDLFAIQLAFQLAQNDRVSVEVVRVLPASTTATEAEEADEDEEEELKNSLTEIVAKRVSFRTSHALVAQAVLETIGEPAFEFGPDHLVLLGRNGLGADTLTALGQAATECVTALCASPGMSSMLVVQAMRNPDGTAARPVKALMA